jgi:hypothetical protein
VPADASDACGAKRACAWRTQVACHSSWLAWGGLVRATRVRLHTSHGADTREAAACVCTAHNSRCTLLTTRCGTCCCALQAPAVCIATAAASSQGFVKAPALLLHYSYKRTNHTRPAGAVRSLGRQSSPLQHLSYPCMRYSGPLCLRSLQQDICMCQTAPHAGHTTAATAQDPASQLASCDAQQYALPADVQGRTRHMHACGMSRARRRTTPPAPHSQPHLAAATAPRRTTQWGV